MLDGLAWDWVNAKLYWTDYCADEIEVYDLETRDRKVIVRTGTNSNPRGIVLDPSTRYAGFYSYDVILLVLYITS